jgi:hypothetical protein
VKICQSYSDQFGKGKVVIVQDVDCDGIAIIEALPNEEDGYFFHSWVDGNTDNPRSAS